MAKAPWYLEIVQVSSLQKQQDLLTLLREVAEVTALGSSSGDDYFVIYDCPDRRLKSAVEKLFAAVDPDSHATYSLDEPDRPDGGAA